MAVRTARTELGTAQETLAHLAGIERSHMGKIERGEHMPNLAIILRIAKALNSSASELIAATEKNLQAADKATERSEEHTSELQSLMRISYAVFCLKKKKKDIIKHILRRNQTNTSLQE